ncbi:MAG TPA: SusC/RagA family TonB-linked outer membrane protein, partial [Paludibacter sp.]|nr:SusC/RagA family TonB-linked outer membrane protein [Paludibacter sp.]
IYASDLLGSKGISGNDISTYGFMNVDKASSTYNIYHNNTNWNDEIYQNGLTNSYLINASGGDEKALYYFSVGYTTNKGVVKTTDFQRINTRFNADFKLVENFDLAMNIAFSRIERSLLNDGMDQYTSPTWISAVKSPFLSPNSFTSKGEKTASFAYADEFDISNPLGLIYGSINNLKNYRFNIGLTPSIKITPELTLTSQFDFNLHKTIEGHFIPMYYTARRNIVDKGYSYNQISSQVMRNTAFFDDTRLTYNKKLNALNTLKAMYGFRFINNYYESDFVEEHNSGSNNNTTITGSYDYLRVNGINNSTNSLSHYLNGEYDYDKRFFVNATVSLDASSRFGRKTEGGIRMFGESWGVFPTVNAAWLVTSEEFMKNVSLIDFLKLRVGYGITGNDGIRDYESMAYFNAVRFYERANGLVITNLENTKIQWENTMRANLGFDLGLLNDRLSVSLDYFNGTTNHLLIMKDLPIISGLGKYWTNGGSLKNNGLEFSLNMKVLNLKNLKWELGLSAGHYQNEITHLDVEGGSYTTKVYDGEVLMAEGQPVGVFYGYKTKGVFSTQPDATAAGLKIMNEDGTFTDFNAGDIIFEDKVVDGIIDEKDKQIIGNPNPDLYGNITSKWTVNRFTLSTVLTYSYGNDVYNYYRSQLESGSDFSNQTTTMLSRWTADNQTTLQPKAAYGDPMGNARFSDRWIEDGSYLRMKNITLSYELPLKSKYFEGLNLWVSANNLFTVTNYLGLDPEFSAGNSVYYQGIDAGLIPLTKSYYFGIKLNL